MKSSPRRITKLPRAIPAILAAASSMLLASWLLTRLAPQHWSRVSPEATLVLNLNGGLSVSWLRRVAASEDACARHFQIGIRYLGNYESWVSPARIDRYLSGNFLPSALALLGFAAITAAVGRWIDNGRIDLHGRCNIQTRRNFNAERHCATQSNSPLRRQQFRVRAMILLLLASFSGLIYAAWVVGFWIPFRYDVHCPGFAREFTVSTSLSYARMMMYLNTSSGNTLAKTGSEIPFLGGYQQTESPRVFSAYELILSFFPLWLVLGALPATAFIRGPLRRDYRARRGRCVDCGYDLRADRAGICPECGRPVAHDMQNDADAS